MEHSLKKKKKKKVLLSCTTGDKVLVTPNAARGDLEGFQQSGILLERPCEFPCPSLTCCVPNMIKTLSALPEGQHETSGAWQWCRRMLGGKIRECRTKASFGVLCIPSSSISTSQWPLQSILTAPNCQKTTDLLQTSGPGIKGRYILFYLFKE